ERGLRQRLDVLQQVELPAAPRQRRDRPLALVAPPVKREHAVAALQAQHVAEVVGLALGQLHGIAGQIAVQEKPRNTPVLDGHESIPAGVNGRRKPVTVVLYSPPAGPRVTLAARAA